MKAILWQRRNVGNEENLEKPEWQWRARSHPSSDCLPGFYQWRFCGLGSDSSLSDTPTQHMISWSKWFNTGRTADGSAHTRAIMTGWEIADFQIILHKNAGSQRAFLQFKAVLNESNMALLLIQESVDRHPEEQTVGEGNSLSPDEQERSLHSL